jgi:sugar phosphate isomerase/epimerase
MMKISIFYCHITEIAEKEGISVSEALRDMKALGIDAVDFDAGDLRAHPEWADEVFAADMKIASIHEFFDIPNHPEQDPRCTVDLALKYGVKNVMIIPGFLTEEEMPVYENDEQVRAEMARSPKIGYIVEAFRRGVEYAKDKGVNITMEPYGDPLHAPFGRVAHFLYYTDMVEGLKMTLDTGNFIYADEDSLDAEARLGHLVTHVHLKDYAVDPDFAPRRFLRGKVPATIGGGYIPVWHILDRLEARGYDGYLTIEEFLLPDQRRAAEESVAFIKSFLNRNA